MDNIIFIIYGILLIVGGWIGFAKAGSKISLISGLLGGILILVGAYIWTINETDGYTLVCTISGVLSVPFLIRLIKKRKFMPSGLLFILSFAVFIFSIDKLLRM